MSEKTDFYGQRDESEGILVGRITNSFSNVSWQESGLVDQIRERLDKIIMVVLVLLIILFLFQSPSQSPQTVVNAGDGAKDAVQSGRNGEMTLSKPQGKGQENTQKKQQGKEWDPYQPQNSDDQSIDFTKKHHKKSGQSVSVDKQEKQLSQEELLTRRERDHKVRSDIFKQQAKKNDKLSNLRLAKFNLDASFIDTDEEETLFEIQRDSLRTKYNLSEYQSEQISICTVIYATNHNKGFAHQYVLNSVLNQEYQNFIVVYIADGYSAQEVDRVKKYIKTVDIDHRVNFQWNPEKKFFLESTVKAVKDYCPKKKVVATIDGDDELISRQVFSVLNSYYRGKGANVVYSNYVEYHHNEKQMKLGMSTEYELKEKTSAMYRAVGQKFGSLKTFRTKLLQYIDEKDFKDNYGSYYRYAGDYALMFPLLELSCAKVFYVPEYFYLYYGYEVDPTYGPLQINTGREIKTSKHRYECYQSYD